MFYRGSQSPNHWSYIHWILVNTFSQSGSKLYSMQCYLSLICMQTCVWKHWIFLKTLSNVNTSGPLMVGRQNILKWYNLVSVFTHHRFSKLTYDARQIGLRSYSENGCNLRGCLDIESVVELQYMQCFWPWRKFERFVDEDRFPECFLKKKNTGCLTANKVLWICITL